MTQRQHLHATPVILDVGDSVMKHSPKQKFMSPFLVISKLLGNRFKVLDPITSLSEVIYADRLKNFCSALSPVADTSLSPDSSSSVSPPISTPPSASACTAATPSTVPPPVSSVSLPDSVYRLKLRSAYQV